MGNSLQDLHDSVLKRRALEQLYPNAWDQAMMRRRIHPKLDRGERRIPLDPGRRIKLAFQTPSLLAVCKPAGIDGLGEIREPLSLKFRRPGNTGFSGGPLSHAQMVGCYLTPQLSC